VLNGVFSWMTAKKACDGHGAALVSIPNNATNSAILSYARSEQSMNFNTDVIIGLNYVQQPDGKSWLWQWADGSKATFTNWREGDPNEPDPRVPALTGAVMSVLDWDLGQWFTIDPNHELSAAICERRPNY
ncbi:serum lectin isoform 1 precursor, partial [Aphelenchoides avenae]